MANLPRGLCLFVILFVGSLINASDAEIHKYDNKRFTKIANGLYVHGDSEAIYGSKSSSGTHSKGMSFIRFDEITFLRTKEAASKQKSKLGTSGLVETIVFEINDRERIGGSYFKSDAICCTSELADVGSCNLGEVIIRRDPNEHEWPKKISTFFQEYKEEVKMSPEALVINKTGLYTVYFMTCDQNLDGIVVRGKSVWKSLDGYLPGDKVPLLNVYVFMFVAYVVLSLLWSSQVFRYLKDSIHLHGYIHLVIGFSMSELASLYAEFSFLDSTGISPIKTTLWTITASSLKKAMSRLLLLFISSGYGIVKLTFGGVTLMMLLAGLLCFVISEALGLATHFANISENGLTTLLMLSWAILETFFVLWIFRSLWQTLKKLKVNKRNIAKLQLYKKFARVLVIIVVLSFFWNYVEVYVYNSLSEFWQVKWIIPTFWYLLSYGVLVLICFYWAPTENPTR